MTKDTVIGKFENPSQLDILQVLNKSGSLMVSMDSQGVVSTPEGPILSLPSNIDAGTF